MSYIIGLNTNILPNGYQPILTYYNENRPEGTEELQILNRVEGGFMIKIPMEKEKKDELHDTKYNDLIENNRIHQLRWSNLRLVSDIYFGFTNQQLDLLYESLVNYLGEENVYKIENTVINNRISGSRIDVQVSNGKHYIRAMY